MTKPVLGCTRMKHMEKITITAITGEEPQRL